VIKTQRFTVYPAAWDECIAVAANDWFGGRSMFSQFGDWVSVSAPGGTDMKKFRYDENDILSTTPFYDVVLHHGIPHLTLQYGFLAGTSMACPHVSGLAGLILSQNPNLTNKEVRERILGTADVTNNFYNEAFDSVGTGRINS